MAQVSVSTQRGIGPRPAHAPCTSLTNRTHSTHTQTHTQRRTAQRLHSRNSGTTCRCSSRCRCRYRCKPTAVERWLGGPHRLAFAGVWPPVCAARFTPLSAGMSPNARNHRESGQKPSLYFSFRVFSTPKFGQHERCVLCPHCGPRGRHSTLSAGAMCHTSTPSRDAFGLAAVGATHPRRGACAPRFSVAFVFLNQRLGTACAAAAHWGLLSRFFNIAAKAAAAAVSTMRTGRAAGPCAVRGGPANAPPPVRCLTSPRANSAPHISPQCRTLQSRPTPTHCCTCLQCVRVACGLSFDNVCVCVACVCVCFGVCVRCVVLQGLLPSARSASHNLFVWCAKSTASPTTSEDAPHGTPAPGSSGT